jgi:hypothetical protein
VLPCASLLAGCANYMQCNRLHYLSMFFRGGIRLGVLPAYMFLYAFSSVWISFSSALYVAESSGFRLDTVRVVVLFSFLPAVWRVVLISIGPAALFFGFFPLAAFPPFVVPFAFFGGINIYIYTPYNFVRSSYKRICRPLPRPVATSWNINT